MNKCVNKAWKGTLEGLLCEDMSAALFTTKMQSCMLEDSEMEQ